MCKLKIIPNNGCFDHQRLISCALENKRVFDSYGLGEIIYVSDDIGARRKFISEVYPTHDIEIISYSDIQNITKEVDTLYLEMCDNHKLNASLWSTLNRLRIKTIITDE